MQETQSHHDQPQDNFDERYMSLSFDGDTQGLFELCHQHPDLFFEKVTKDKTVSSYELLQFLAFLSGNCQQAWVTKHQSEIEKKIEETKEEGAKEAQEDDEREAQGEKNQRMRDFIIFHRTVGSNCPRDALRIQITVRNADQYPYGEDAVSPRLK